VSRPPQVEGTMHLNRPGRRLDKPKGRIGRKLWDLAHRVPGRLGIRWGGARSRSARTLGQQGEEAHTCRLFLDLR